MSEFDSLPDPVVEKPPPTRHLTLRIVSGNALGGRCVDYLHLAVPVAPTSRFTIKKRTPTLTEYVYTPDRHYPGLISVSVEEYEVPDE